MDWDTAPLPLTCPYCAEDVDLDIDESGGSRQSFVEDCPVCCRPWEVEVTLDQNGEWNAVLRTADE
jgi:cysteine-rich CPXCG protein